MRRSRILLSRSDPGLLLAIKSAVARFMGEAATRQIEALLEEEEVS